MASLLELLNKAATSPSITKEEFGRIMHDELATEKEKEEALEALKDLGGYDCLPD